MEYLIITVLLIVLFLVTLRKEEKLQNINVMSYSPTTVANYFIEKYSKEGELTPMKLLKLTYIAYGWYLAITKGEEKLLNEQPVAWDLGPVFPSLYSNIKKSYEKWKITKKIPVMISENILDRDKKFLDKIWNIYGIHDGEYLSALTHEKGTPWDEVYCKGCNSILSDESILKHYTSKLKPA
jgi:uncharacterized phage-associated protein